MKKSALSAFCLILISLTSIISAQSLLSLQFPLGNFKPSQSSRSLMFGGAGTADATDLNVMNGNPASLGAIEKTVFSSLFLSQITRIKEDALATNHFAFIPSQLSFAFPLGAAGAIAFGFEKRSVFNEIFRSEAIAIDPYDPLSTQQIGLSRTGGINVWQAGWGISLPKNIKLGLSYERTYFTINNNIVQSSVVSGKEFFSRDSSSLSWQGNGVRAGIIIPLASFTVGLAGEYFFEGLANLSHAVYADSAGYLRKLSTTSGEGAINLQLPVSIQGGIGYTISPEWYTVLDVQTTLYSSTFVSDSALSPATAANSFSFSLGGQYIPAPNLLTPRYWETINYRAGAHFSQLPVSTAMEFGGIIGCGLPLIGGGMFDIALGIDRRFDTRFVNYSEDVFTLAVGVNAGRKWKKSTQGY